MGNSLAEDAIEVHRGVIVSRRQDSPLRHILQNMTVDILRIRKGCRMGTEPSDGEVATDLQIVPKTIKGQCSDSSHEIYTNLQDRARRSAQYQLNQLVLVESNGASSLIW